MDGDRFWAIVDATTRADDLEEQADLLTEQLEVLPVEEVVSFDDWYTRASHALYTWRVWRAADVMIGDASDDVFADFRSWVISRGSAAHAAVLADVDAGLAALVRDDVEEIGDGELFGAVAGEVFEEKTGTALYDAFEDRPSADFPHGEPTGPDVAGGRDQRRAQFPLLTAACAPTRRPRLAQLAASFRFPWRD